ncbi:MAG: hypothetical protein QME59_05775 [Candidatus Hydrothermarchaeota archaeon]|nr:hypothetical protein [Candidatus Hydrothermarchaeota archaeon]
MDLYEARKAIEELYSVSKLFVAKTVVDEAVQELEKLAALK